MDPGNLASMATASKKTEQGLRMRRSRGGIFASCAQKIAANLRRPFPTRPIDPLRAVLLLCLLAGACGILLWQSPAKEQRTSSSVGQQHAAVEDTITVRSRHARRGASSDFAIDPWEDLDEETDGSNRGYTKGWGFGRRPVYSTLPWGIRWRHWWADVWYSVKVKWRTSKNRCSGALRRAIDHLGDSYLKWDVKHALWGTPTPSSLWDVNELVGAPSSWPQGSRQRMCEVVGPAGGAQRVAIVGNGPLTAEQRTAIDACDSIVRFNAMNNRLEGERTDMWIVRYNDQPPLFFWGFMQLKVNASAKILADAKAVLFLGGPLTRYPAAYRSPVTDLLLELDDEVPADKLFQLNITGYWDLYTRVLSWDWDIRFDSQAMPSSGLVGLLAVLGCVDPKQQDVHLFGFNWSNASYFMHKMGAEALIAGQLLRQYRVEVHPVPCSGLYSCDPKCDKNSYRAVVDGLPPACAAKVLSREMNEAAAKAAEKERRREATFGPDRSYTKTQGEAGSDWGPRSTGPMDPYFGNDLPEDDDDDLYSHKDELRDRSGTSNSGGRRFGSQFRDGKMGFLEEQGWKEATW